jgi:hypothetical protein
MVERRADLALLPPAVLRLNLAKPEGPAGLAEVARPPGPSAAGGLRLRRQPPGGKAQPEEPTSWWTARATAGEVAPGFSRDEILAQPAPDPAAPGGLFERLAGLLTELSRSVVPD